MTLPVRAFPGTQLMVSVLEHALPEHTHRVQLEVHVVEPAQLPVPATPPYAPHVPPPCADTGVLLGVLEGEGVAEADWEGSTQREAASAPGARVSVPKGQGAQSKCEKAATVGL